MAGLALRDGCELIEVAEGVWDYMLKAWPVWRRSLEMACQRRTGFRCKRNKGIYYQKFRCNQEGGGRSGNDTRVASTARCNQES